MKSEQVAGFVSESMAGFIGIRTNADVAIRLLEADEDIAAVVTDVDMPGTMDGLALAFAVRRRWPPCRLIVVSGHRRPAANDMPDGSRFIRKPLATNDLQRTLSDLGVS